MEPNCRQIRRPRPELRCRKHPKHRQPAGGVCSLCLSEKLSQLSKRSSKYNIVATASSCSSSSSLSSLSSHYSSSEASPIHERRGMELNGKGFLSVLGKSRSMVAAYNRREGDGKKKEGFWAKLLRPRSKKMDRGGLVHSSTVRELRVH
ncbi:uncharacterized protein LOC127800169 [Diospyros lotus]|uniref:uncharacterized protein LOC127800169 n=1 Tax=Diospyros lotus TaxID=55363 RepID=UPI00225A7C95|nr:uncharacterized protein LOC127800169 [Diospyros lotus]